VRARKRFSKSPPAFSRGYSEKRTDIVVAAAADFKEIFHRKWAGAAVDFAQKSRILFPNPVLD
jgi:hypothetical protein